MINSTATTSSSVSLYGLMILAGIIISTIFCYIEWRKKGESPFKFWLLYGWVVVLAIFGARWWYLIFNPSDFTGSIMDWFWLSGGRSILGSIFFVVLGIFVFQKYWMPDSEFRKILSIALPHMLLAQAVARWGNFFNQEVYGQAVANLDWLPSWIADHMYIDGAFRQPLFLYESLIMFTGFIVIYFMKMNKNIKPGVHGASTLMIYGLTRSSMELLRDDQFIMKWIDFPTSFMLAIILSLVGIFLVIYYQWIYQDKTAVYFEFYSPAKNNLYWKNIIGFSKKIMFIEKRSFSTILENNKTHYNNIISKVKKSDIKRFKEKIKEPY